MEKQSITCRAVWIPRERAVVSLVTLTKDSEASFHQHWVSHGWELPSMQRMKKSERGSWSLWGTRQSLRGAIPWNLPLGSPGHKEWGMNAGQLTTGGEGNAMTAWQRPNMWKEKRERETQKREVVSVEMCHPVQKVQLQKRETTKAKGREENGSIEKGKQPYLYSPPKLQDSSRIIPVYWVNTVGSQFSGDTYTDSREKESRRQFFKSRNDMLMESSMARAYLQTLCEGGLLFKAKLILVWYAYNYVSGLL